MVTKLECHHQHSSEESRRRYVPSAALASGDEKKRKALDGFTHHKLLDRHNRESSRRTKSESPHLPVQKPPRADAAKRSVRSVAKEDRREKIPVKPKDFVTGSFPANHNNLEIRQDAAATRLLSSGALSESNKATQSTGRDRSVDRVSRERSQRGWSVGQAYVSETQSQDGFDVQYQGLRTNNEKQDSISVEGSRATSKASRLPKNVHRMPVSRNASKVSSKTSKSKHSANSKLSNKNSRQSYLSGEVRSDGASLQTKKLLHVQTDIQANSPSQVAVVDPYSSQVSNEKQKIAVMSRNEQESNGIDSKQAKLADSHSETDRHVRESISPIDRLLVGKTPNTPCDVIQFQSNKKVSLDVGGPKEHRQATKRKLDRLLFFRNATRGISVPRSPRKLHQNSEKLSVSSLCSEPLRAVDRKSVDEASLPMNGNAVLNNFLDNSSIAETMKSTRSRSWMKFRKSLKRRNSGKQESPSPPSVEDHKSTKDCVVLPIVETKQQKKETSEPKKNFRRPSLRSPRHKKELSKEKKSVMEKPTPKSNEDELQSRIVRSPRKSAVGIAEINQNVDVIAVQSPQLLVSIDSETEDAVEAVLGSVSSEMIAPTLHEDADTSVGSRQSEQQPSTLQKGMTPGHDEGRCDMEDPREEQDTCLREGEVDRDSVQGNRNRARGERLLQELYGGKSKSFDERSLSRFISSPNHSSTDHTEFFHDSKMSRSRRKANRSFSFSEDEDECSEMYSEGHEDECSDASTFSEGSSSSEESAEDEQSERSAPYESDQSSCTEIFQNQSNDDSTVSTLSIIKNLKLSRKGISVNSSISESSDESEWSDMESLDSDEESLSEKDVVQRLLLSKYRKEHR